MSLSLREQQQLDAMCRQLGEADPRLAGLMETFGRLAAGDAMPSREQLLRPARHHPARLACLTSTKALVVMWLVLGLLLFGSVAVSAALNRHGSASCRVQATVGCSGPVLPTTTATPGSSSSGR